MNARRPEHDPQPVREDLLLVTKRLFMLAWRITGDPLEVAATNELAASFIASRLS